ncbi:hypothetical protein [Niabella ginsengisoli]|nr:hypothetical protein [Niabella ginsengisoli]
MSRIVVTGIGIITAIGNNADETATPWYRPKAALTRLRFSIVNT